MPKNPWGWVAVSFMVSMFVILWPKGETRKAMRERIVYVLPQDEIPEEAARLRGQAVFEEAKRLSGTDNYPAERYIVDMIELSRLRVYSRYMGRFNNNAIFSMTRNHVANLFLSQKEEVRSRLRTPALQEGIENGWSRYDRFVPEETRWHFMPLWKHFISSYPLTVLLALLYHVSILAFRRRVILSELLVPDRLLRASIFWPVQLWYETREPREQFRRASAAVAYAVAGAFCMFLPSAARAQNKESGNRRINNTLQVDLRNSWFLTDGPPDLNLFNRLTFYRGRGAVEIITTATPSQGRWYNESVLGYAFVSKPGVKILGIGAMSHSNTGAKQILAGGQVLWFGRWGVFALPVARYEHGINNRTRSVAVVANPMLRAPVNGWLRQVAMTADVSARKGPGKPTSWNMGGGPRFFPDPQKPLSFETAVLRNREGLWQFRARALSAFVF